MMLYLETLIHLCLTDAAGIENDDETKHQYLASLLDDPNFHEVCCGDDLLNMFLDQSLLDNIGIDHYDSNLIPEVEAFTDVSSINHKQITI